MKIDMTKIHKSRLVAEVEKHAQGAEFSGQFDLNGPIGSSPSKTKDSPFFIPVTHIKHSLPSDSPKGISIKISKNKRILEHLTKFSQNIDDIRDKEGMSLLYYDFNGFKSSMSHRSSIDNNLQ
jgi:hypothetical protein